MINHATIEDQERVMVYGAAWCEHTTYIRRLLTQWGVPFHYIDIDADDFAKEKVAAWNFGELTIPAISMGARENPRLLAPSDAALHGMLYTSEQVRVGPLLL